MTRDAQTRQKDTKGIGTQNELGGDVDIITD